MPRISAPTVAEHRERQRAALLSAGIALLVKDGVKGTTLAAVGAAAGLARSSVYQYFESSDALVAACVEESFALPDAELAAAVRSAGSPVEAVDAYVRTALRLGAAGAFGPATALGASDVPNACKVRLAELYAIQAEPLLESLRAAGVPDPVVSCLLVRAVLRGAVEAIENGASPRAVRRRTRELLRSGLALD